MSEVDKSLGQSSKDCENTFASKSDLNAQKMKPCMMLNLELETKNVFAGM